MLLACKKADFPSQLWPEVGGSYVSEHEVRTISKNTVSQRSHKETSLYKADMDKRVGHVCALSL